MPCDATVGEAFSVGSWHVIGQGKPAQSFHSWCDCPGRFGFCRSAWVLDFLVGSVPPEN